MKLLYRLSFLVASTFLLLIVHQLTTSTGEAAKVSNTSASFGNDHWECPGNLVIDPKDPICVGEDPNWCSIGSVSKKGSIPKICHGICDCDIIADQYLCDQCCRQDAKTLNECNPQPVIRHGYPNWCSIGSVSKKGSIPKICHGICGCDGIIADEYLCDRCCRQDAKTLNECNPQPVKACPANNHPTYCHGQRDDYQKLYVNSDPSKCVVLPDLKPPSFPEFFYDDETQYETALSNAPSLGIGPCTSNLAVKFLSIKPRLATYGAGYLRVDDTAPAFACYEAVLQDKPNSLVKLMNTVDAGVRFDLSYDKTTQKPKAVRVCGRRDDCWCDIDDPKCDAKLCLAAVDNKVQVIDCETASKKGLLIAPKASLHYGRGARFC